MIIENLPQVRLCDLSSAELTDLELEAMSAKTRAETMLVMIQGEVERRQLNDKKGNNL